MWWWLQWWWLWCRRSRDLSRTDPGRSLPRSTSRADSSVTFSTNHHTFDDNSPPPHYQPTTDQHHDSHHFEILILNRHLANVFFAPLHNHDSSPCLCDRSRQSICRPHIACHTEDAPDIKITKMYPEDDKDEVSHPSCRIGDKMMIMMIRFSNEHRSRRIAFFNIAHELSKLRTALSNTPAMHAS